jgi:VanZ family protein
MTKSKLFYWLPPIAWAAGIFLLSCLPFKQTTPLFTGVDKVFHVGLFGMLSVLLFFAFFYERRHPALKAALLALLITAAYGAFDEFHQLFTPTRSCDVFDWLADAAGGTIAFLACLRHRAAPKFLQSDEQA